MMQVQYLTSDPPILIGVQGWAGWAGCLIGQHAKRRPIIDARPFRQRVVGEWFFGLQKQLMQAYTGYRLQVHGGLVVMQRNATELSVCDHPWQPLASSDWACGVLWRVAGVALLSRCQTPSSLASPAPGTTELTALFERSLTSVSGFYSRQREMVPSHHPFLPQATLHQATDS